MNIALKRHPHITETQANINRTIDRQVADAQATPENPLVIPNPYGLAPLTALVCFQTEMEDQYVVTVKGKTQAADLSYAGAYTTDHRIPVIGLYPGAPTTVVLRNRAGIEQTLTLEAPPLAHDVPAYAAEESGTYNSLLFFLPADPAIMACAFDAAGDCRWVADTALAHRLQLDREGYLLTGAPPSLAPPYSPTALWQMDLTGRIRKEIRFPGGACCDFLQLPEHDVVSIGQDVTSGMIADHVHWVDNESGALKRSLSLRDVVPPATGSPAQSGTDWFQARTLNYNEDAHTLTVSGAAQGVVVEIDAATAKPLRVLADTGQWDAFPRPALLPSEVQQHVLRDPYGADMQGDTCTLVCANRYDADRHEVRETLQIERILINDASEQFVTFPANLPVSPLFNRLRALPDNTYALHAGSCAAMPDGSQPKVPGIFNRLRYPETALWSERLVCREDEVIHHSRYNTNTLDAQSIHVPNLRFMPYADQGVCLGEWDEQPEVDVELPVTAHEPLEEDNALELWCDDARLYVKGLFFQGEMCLLVLRQGATEKKYFMQTSRKPFGADWLMTYTDGMERPVTWAVPVHHLTGTWDIGLQIDDTYFETGATLTL